MSDVGIDVYLSALLSWLRLLTMSLQVVAGCHCPIQNLQMQEQLEMTKQAGQMASAPMNDPSKNPALNAQLENESANEEAAQEESGAPS